MGKCLYCYKKLREGDRDFHPACSQKIFGTKVPPILPYVRNQLADLAEQVIRSQTTLTGVQAKLSLDIHKGERNEPERFTIVGLWGRYILKPQTDLYPYLPELEDLTMHLAEIVRIKVVPHSLIRFQDGELCYITRRIDRRENGTKLPMEDMCQLAERLTEYKYKGSYDTEALIPPALRINVKLRVYLCIYRRKHTAGCYYNTVIHTIHYVLPCCPVPYTYNKEYQKIGKAYRQQLSYIIAKCFLAPLTELVHTL